ncbi:---NA--- [Paramuricea clavata]|uniref:---NA n=1 Tax=Paramuricea clavata TaxID=317549 RepID=A0A7D9DI56_PARCT|nr:---NA--- [Paramuricea clavata]
MKKHSPVTVHPQTLLEHNGKGIKRAHYHCPHCDKTILIRNRFTKHVGSHAKRHEAKQVTRDGVSTISNIPDAPSIETSIPNPPSLEQIPPNLEQPETIQNLDDDQKLDEEVSAKRRKKGMSGLWKRNGFT